MRISTTQLFSQGTNSMIAKQQDLAQVLQQISSGKRINSPSDDPQSAASVLNIAGMQAAVDQYQRNGGILTSRLSQEENALINVTDALTRVKELAIYAGNPILTALDRASLASEIKGRLKELVDAGNVRDANGEYIFGGFQRTTPPFSQDQAGNVIYNGDQGQRALQIGANRQVLDSDNGFSLFMAGMNGNGTFTANSDPINVTNYNTAVLTATTPPVPAWAPSVSEIGSGTISVGSVTDPTALVPGANYQIVFSGGLFSGPPPLPDLPLTYDVTDTVNGGTPIVGAPYTDGAAIQFDGMAVTITGQPQTGDTFNVLPSNNQSIFYTVNKLVSALGNYDATPPGNAVYQELVGQVISELGIGMNQVEGIHASVGARMNGADSQEQINADIKLNLSTMRSKLEDTDLVAASTRLELDKTALSAAYQAFSQIKGMSLFSYL